jgi:hypothetical protein
MPNYAEQSDAAANGMCEINPNVGGLIEKALKFLHFDWLFLFIQ